MGKGGRRRDASLPEAAIAKVNAVTHKETMIDLLPQQKCNSDAKRQECQHILKRATCEAIKMSKMRFFLSHANIVFHFKIRLIYICSFLLPFCPFGILKSVKKKLKIT